MAAIPEIEVLQVPTADPSVKGSVLLSGDCGEFAGETVGLGRDLDGPPRWPEWSLFGLVDLDRPEDPQNVWDKWRRREPRSRQGNMRRDSRKEDGGSRAWIRTTVDTAHLVYSRE